MHQKDMQKRKESIVTKNQQVRKWIVEMKELADLNHDFLEVKAFIKPSEIDLEEIKASGYEVEVTKEGIIRIWFDLGAFKKAKID